MMAALFAFGFLAIFIVPQIVLVLVLGSRRDGTSFLTKEFWS